MSTLSTPRAVLTSLFNTLTTPSSKPTEELVNTPYDPPSNPLKAISPAHRALLSTMHVLFTPPMLLQALDLLDRGLVLRVIERVEGDGQGGGNEREEEGQGGNKGQNTTRDGEGPETFPPQANIHLPPNTIPALEIPDSASTSHTRRRTTLHQVRSSQPPKSRFRDASSSTSGTGTGTGTNIYTVRLEAWNCNCAAFAFASFPAANFYPSRSPWDLDLNQEQNQDPDAGMGFDVDLESEEGLVGNGMEGGGGDGDGDEKWEFGGLSLDGKGGAGGIVPCCKHLLACVLGERWDVLRGYVKERVVSREDMAGLGCEG